MSTYAAAPRRRMEAGDGLSFSPPSWCRRLFLSGLERRWAKARTLSSVHSKPTRGQRCPLGSGQAHTEEITGCWPLFLLGSFLLRLKRQRILERFRINAADYVIISFYRVSGQMYRNPLFSLRCWIHIVLLLYVINWRQHNEETWELFWGGRTPEWSSV